MGETFPILAVKARMLPNLFASQQERLQMNTLQILPQNISVEIVQRNKFLGAHFAENLARTLNTSSAAKKAHQYLLFLWRLGRVHLCIPNSHNTYAGTIEDILCSCILVWDGNSADQIARLYRGK